MYNIEKCGKRTTKGGKRMLDQSYYEKADEIIALYGPKSASLIPMRRFIVSMHNFRRYQKWIIKVFFSKVIFDFILRTENIIQESTKNRTIHNGFGKFG